MKLIALDLHQDTIVSATLEYGEVDPKVTVKKYCLQDSTFQTFLGMLRKDDVIIVESTMNAFWIYRKLEALVKACYVLNTNATHLRGNKTDTLDAKKLLQILSTFVLTNTIDQMPTVYVPSEEVGKLRSLFCTYRLLMKMSTQCRNRIHALYRQNGIVIERKELSEVGYWNTLIEKFPMDDFWREQVQLLIEELSGLRSRIAHTKKTLLFLGMQLFEAEVKILATIPGVSPFTAIAMMSDICDINRFRSAKKLCSYLRTAPSIKASNKTSHLGPVNKAGRSLTVTLLTQSINHLKAALPEYGAFYAKLRVGKSAGKCRIALIRKMLTASYYMLKRDNDFKNKREKPYERKYRDLRAELNGFMPEFMKDVQKTA